MRRWGILTTVLFLTLVGCAGRAPVARQIQSSWTISGSFDIIWSSALEVLAELNVPIIMPIDKASGIITTESVNLPDNEKSCLDCGKLPFTAILYLHRRKLTIFVRPSGDRVELKIVAVFVAQYTDDMADALTTIRREPFQGKTIWERPCISTGQIEREIYDLVSAKIK